MQGRLLIDQTANGSDVARVNNARPKVFESSSERAGVVNGVKLRFEHVFRVIYERPSFGAGRE